ncbi:asparagine synthase family protein [[Eubacterium] cellulosolvens]
MAALVGVLGKHKKPVAESLVNMLKRVSWYGESRISYCINGHHVIADNLDELDKSSLDGSIGIGTSSRGLAELDILHLDGENGYLAFDGHINNLAPSGTKANTVRSIFNNYFDSNDIQGSMKNIIEVIDGGFSFIQLFEDSIIIARDVIGFKPLFVGENDEYIAFASANKVLWELGFRAQIRAVRPGECLIISRDKTISSDFRTEFPNQIKHLDFNECLVKLENLLIDSILKRIRTDEVAVLFSGGLDSTILTHLLTHQGVELRLLNSSFKDSKDHKNAENTAQQLDLPLVVNELTDVKIKRELPNIILHLEDRHPINVEIGIAQYFATQLAKNQGFKTVTAGQGADELFGGYSRYERILKTKDYQRLHDRLYTDVMSLWSHDLERDNILAQANNVELELPYLDTDLVKFCISIPPEFKLKQVNGNYIRKYILVKLGEKLGLGTDILTRPKLAMQFGSGAAKCLKRIANSVGFDGDLARSLRFRNATELLIKCIYQKLKFPIDSEPIPERVLKKVNAII